MNEAEIPTLMQPQWFLPFFAVMWIGISGLLSYFGGWAILARKFEATETVDGERFRFVSGLMGYRFFPVSYGNCLFVTVTPTGLYLSIFFLFRFQSPPLFISWSAVDSVTERRILFLFPYVTIVVKDEWPRVSLRGRAGDAIRRAFSAYGGKYSNHSFNDGVARDGQR